MKKLSIFIIAVVIFNSAVAHAASVITFKNGDKISGEILPADDPQTIRLKTSYAGVIDVSKSDIAGGLDNEFEETKNKDDDNELWGAEWKSAVNFGGNIQTGNSDTKAAAFDFRTKAKWDNDRANLNFENNWETSNDEKVSDSRILESNYDHFLNSSWFDDGKWYSNTNVNLKQDNVADLELRSALGVGLGRQFYDTDTTYLSASFGPTYLRQKFENENAEQSIAAQWNIDYSQKFYDNLFEIFHRHKLFIPTNSASAYLLDTDTGIRIPLNRGFVATAELKYDINNEPAENASKDDTQYLLKLGYEW